MIQQAPWIFGLWTMVIIGAVWAVVSHLKGNQLESLEARLHLRDDEISDYKRKLSGASPDEAKARIDGLEERLNQLMPRRITADQREKIRAALNGSTGYVSINTDMACSDAPPFAAGLSGAFVAAGWQVRNPSFMGLSNPPLSGMGVRVEDPNKLSYSQGIVVAALRTAGLAFEIQRGGMRMPQLPDEPTLDVEIVITPRVLD